MRDEEEAVVDAPARIEVETPERVARWRPLVQWILAIPHLLIAGALEYVTGAVAVVSWFVILVTGRLPAGLADFQIMILRYTTRAELYAGVLHDRYPPFEFAMSAAEPGGTPVRLDVRPTLTDRNRLTVALRVVWVIPALLFGVAVAIVGALAWIGGLIAILFTGRWPAGLHAWVMKTLRVWIRLSVYALLLTDEYPPFSTS